jgi:hypothetical protein
MTSLPRKKRDKSQHRSEPPGRAAADLVDAAEAWRGGAAREPAGDASLAAAEPAADPAAADPAVAGPAPRLPTVKAVIGGVNPQGDITGWACVPDAPTRRARISIFSDGDLVTSGLADLPRPEVGEAGFGDGNSGFALHLPERMFDGALHTFSLVAEAPDAEPLVADITVELKRPTPPQPAPRPRPAAPAVAVPLLLPAGSPGGPAAIYVPGCQITCMLPHPRPAYHTHGWHAPEEEFTWIDGIEGVIEMVVRRPADSYHLRLDIVPNGVGGLLQTLQIHFNHFRVGYFEVPEPARLTVELPAELFTMRKSSLRLHCENAIRVAEFGVPDTRRLGIAVRGWSIG